MCLFSSDFPHVEGGRNPLKRFDDSLVGVEPPAVERFYCRQLHRPDGRGPGGGSAPTPDGDRRVTTSEERLAARRPRRPRGGAQRRGVPGRGRWRCSLVRFFRNILTPLVVATFLLLLIDGVARPHAAAPARGAAPGCGAASPGLLIIAAFAAIGVLLVVEAPPFACQLRGLAPQARRACCRRSLRPWSGRRPMTLRQIFRGADPAAWLGAASSPPRATSSPMPRPGDHLFRLPGRLARGLRPQAGRRSTRATASARIGAPGVRERSSHAVERYARLQTLKALLIALVAWLLMAPLGVHDALFVAFLVFLAAYVPIVGAVIGALFPGLWPWPNSAT